LRGQQEIPDWYPEDRRGQAPAIVRNGRDGVRACGLCHLADGSGRPENAPVNGLHVEYFLQQMEDFKNGLRRSADPRTANTNLMVGFAKGATAEEVRAAAEYFAAQPYPKRIKVIESRTAPKVRLQGGMHMAIPAGEGGGMVPIGNEIVEVPDDNLRAEARDTRLGWTAYVPVGTLRKALADKHQSSVAALPNGLEKTLLSTDLHLGPGPPGAAYESGTTRLPSFRMAAGDPLRLEEVLLRHRPLRLFVMHAAWPQLDSMIALMYAHPNLYVETGALQAPVVTPRAGYSRHLRGLVDAGLASGSCWGPTSRTSFVRASTPSCPRTS
jgi:cytochrome c553